MSLGRGIWPALVPAVVVFGIATAGSDAAQGVAMGGATHTPARAGSKKPQFRTILLGLRQSKRDELVQFAQQVSNPASPLYRQFLTLAQLRNRYSPSQADRNHVLRFLRSRHGVKHVELSSAHSVVLVVMTAEGAQRTFCAKGLRPPLGGLCIPARIRRQVWQISAGERYEVGVGSGSHRHSGVRRAGGGSGTPKGCRAALKDHGFTPNQLSTAYGVDPLHARGLSGRGVRVVTLAAQPIQQIGLKVWAKCFGMPKPRVHGIAMPGGNISTASPTTEEALDIESLASLAPGLARITPIFVPLDQGFSNSFPLFMFGALSPKRQNGHLPDILSISDGVCENQFTSRQLKLSQRMLREAAALGITAMAASGDSGFLGCTVGKSGANFPNSSRWVTGVGGTHLTLDKQNRIARQVVWSTFASGGLQGGGTGGGPSRVWGRPSFQRAPGIGSAIEPSRPTRLGPDIASMGAFQPGIAVYDSGQGGWGADGGTSAATPLSAAILALVSEQERRAHRPALGSLPPLLYSLARGPGYHSIFYDITRGTSSRKPRSAAGGKPSGGAAQPGYDLATGLGSLKAKAFAGAVAALR